MHLIPPSSILSTDALLALEERAFNGWPALHTVHLGGWLCRFADGYGRRANSVNAVAPTAPFETVLRAADELYAKQSLPLTFRLSPLAGSGPDATLAARGFDLVDETLVMIRAIADGATARDPAIALVQAYDDQLNAQFAVAKGLAPQTRRIHERIRASIVLPRTLAVLRDGERAIGFGLGVAERGMIGLFDILVAPTHRRRGAGRKIVDALLAWGRELQATGAYLQVNAQNHPAITLYEQCGFAPAYRYHYRVRNGARNDRNHRHA